MYDFNYFAPTDVLFGKNAEERVAEYLLKYNAKKVLIHYGMGSVVHSGLLEKITDIIDSAGIKYVTLGGVVPNPRLSLVYEGIKLCKEENVDFILAVGGGSVIDSAKAIGYGVYGGGDVWDYYVKKRVSTGCLPIGVILTLAATGSEMSDSSVITNENGMIKRGYSSNYGRATFALLNPELTMTVPFYQTACGITDIIMHTLERYLNDGQSMEITDSLAEGLIRTVISSGRVLLKTPDDYDARAQVMWAGSLSHNGLTGCGAKGDWISHKLEHEISGMYDVAHGAGLSAIWGSWARYVYKNSTGRFAKLGRRVFGVSGDDEVCALKAIDMMEAFFKEIGMPVTLKGLGINPSDNDLKHMAVQCAGSVGGRAGSAKVLDENDMLNILRNAL